MCVYMNSFSYHENARKISNIIFGETFHSSWQDDCQDKMSFLSGREGGGLGAGRVLRPEVKPLPFYTAFPAEKLPFSYTFLDKWYHFHVPSLELCILFLL